MFFFKELRSILFYFIFTEKNVNCFYFVFLHKLAFRRRYVAKKTARRENASAREEECRTQYIKMSADIMSKHSIKVSQLRMLLRGFQTEGALGVERQGQFGHTNFVWISIQPMITDEVLLEKMHLVFYQ